MFDIDLFVHQVQQLLRDRDMAYRKGCDDICDHCKNKVNCNPKKCTGYISGNDGFIDGKPVKFKWDCRDFDYGTCSMMENTPCFKCFENDYSGFHYNGTDYDFSEALEQLKALYQNGQSAIDTNCRLVKTIEDLKRRLFEERNDQND